MTAPLVVATRADDRRCRARSGLALQPWCWACSTAPSPMGQTPASSVGRWPGALKEPVPPVVVEHAACPCSGAPLLMVPSLAAAKADGNDGTTLLWLLKVSLRQRQKEEEDMKEK